MPTYARVAAVQLREVCRALELDAHAGAVQALFTQLAGGWSDHRVASGPLWRSDLTDDHTPYELSIAYREDRPELRLLVEAQIAAGSVHDQWRAGLALQAALASSPAARARFDAVCEAFAPEASCGAAFALWHAAVFDPAGRHLIKAYLNPRIAGQASAPGRVRAALAAVGLEEAWAAVARLSDAHGELWYLSLDLVDAGARIKVYVAHPGRTLDEYADQLGAVSPIAADDAVTLIGAFACGTQRFTRRPLLTCLAFRPGATEPEATIHFPVRSYVRSDQDSLDGIRRCLHPRAAAQLTEAVQRLAGAPLAASRGRVSYVSRTRTAAGLRHTVYVAPLCHAAQPGHVAADAR